MISLCRVWAVYRHAARLILPVQPTAPTEDMEKSAITVSRVTYERSGTVLMLSYATK